MKIMEKHSSLLSYASSVVMGLSVNEIVGIALGVGTFLVNWYYKAKDDKRRDRRKEDHQ